MMKKGSKFNILRVKYSDVLSTFLIIFLVGHMFFDMLFRLKLKKSKF